MNARAARISTAVVSLTLFAAALPAAQADPADPVLVPNWSEERPASSPGAREGAAMAYDAARGEMVLFGGETQQGEQLADTWTWDGEDWTQETPPNSPSPRSNAGMAFDAASGQMLLVGGQPDNGTLDETWTWDGSTWTELSPPTPAPEVFNPSIAYDPGMQRVLLFGGTATSGDPQNSTWSWNGSNWTELAPQTSPEPRWGAAMAYDLANGEMVLFGGVGENSGYTDTWTWNGSTWTQETPATLPPLSFGMPMAYSPATGSVIKLAGNEPETWGWDGTDWSEVPTLTNPPGRAASAMALDEARNEVVLFGGFPMEGPFFGDTWTFGVPSVPRTCRKVPGNLKIRTFGLIPPLGDAPPVPGLRIRVVARRDVNAKIAPSITFTTRRGAKTVQLRTRTIRVDRNRKLRFRLPAIARRQLRRTTGSPYGNRVTFRLRASIKVQGDPTSCFRPTGTRTLRAKVVNVSSRVALRRR